MNGHFKEVKKGGSPIGIWTVRMALAKRQGKASPCSQDTNKMAAVNMG